MYRVTKRMEISACHKLNLDYESKCQNVHGHNWIVWVTCTSCKLNKNGMVIDFTHIKNLIHKKLDHQNLNEIFDFNPTAENMAKWICDTINEHLKDKGACCASVSVQESEGNIAEYIY